MCIFNSIFVRRKTTTVNFRYVKNYACKLELHDVIFHERNAQYRTRQALREKQEQKYSFYELLSIARRSYV